jgi:hypothetical protein
MSAEPLSRLCSEILDTEPSRRTAMLLLATCEQVARKLDHFDQEVIGFAMRNTANDLVGPQLSESTTWN